MTQIDSSKRNEMIDLISDMVQIGSATELPNTSTFNTSSQSQPQIKSGKRS